jgi:hypothetical protein
VLQGWREKTRLLGPVVKCLLRARGQREWVNKIQLHTMSWSPRVRNPCRQHGCMHPTLAPWGLKYDARGGCALKSLMHAWLSLFEKSLCIPVTKGTGICYLCSELIECIGGCGPSSTSCTKHKIFLGKMGGIELCIDLSLRYRNYFS